MHVLVTGAAGFIGYHVSERLVRSGHTVVGLDNLNDYYDPALKEARLARLAPLPEFRFVRADLADDAAIAELFAAERFSHVVHLAAQAGVRYSLVNPRSYVQSNLVGFANILEGCRHSGVEHLVYASSSSVYGMNTKMPFAVGDAVDHPVSLYAASKKSNEMMAHAYSHLFRLPATGLRFFTVYGPWGRPDMALYIFTKAILEDRPIPVFNHGKMLRDFTYIDDIVDGVVGVLEHPAAPSSAWNPADPDPSISSAPYALYNIGNNNAVELGAFIDVLERALGKQALRDYKPMQPGDVAATYADIAPLRALTGFAPRMPLEQGIARFVDWYREYHHIA